MCYPICRVLDIGCGEGYYTCHLAQELSSYGIPFEVMGMNISKIALDKAAKRWKGCGLSPDRMTFAVASAFHLPVAQGSCQIVLNLFALYCGEG